MIYDEHFIGKTEGFAWTDEQRAQYDPDNQRNRETLVVNVQDVH